MACGAFLGAVFTYGIYLTPKILGGGDIDFLILSFLYLPMTILMAAGVVINSFSPRILEFLTPSSFSFFTAVLFIFVTVLNLGFWILLGTVTGFFAASTKQLYKILITTSLILILIYSLCLLVLSFLR